MRYVRGFIESGAGRLPSGLGVARYLATELMPPSAAPAS